MTPDSMRYDQPSRMAPQAEGPKTILLVEDDPLTANMYQVGLSTMVGYRVVLARTGDEALSEMHSASPPSLIILDLGLPGADGLEVLQAARAWPATARVPVIILSNRDGDFEEARRRGASLCLAKYRTTPAQLLTTIRPILKAA
jgi:CheY-like chemotaxis protein